MASIDKRPNGKYRARWREYPGGPQKTKQFARKIDAQRFLVDVEHRLLSGSYVSPESAQTPVRAYIREHLERQPWRSSTADSAAWALGYVEREMGQRPLGSIRKSDVQAFVSKLDRAPGTVGLIFQHFNAMLAAAVEDGLIARNPAQGVKLPALADGEVAPPTTDEVEALYEAAAPWFRPAIVAGAGLGLRQAEASGLTADRILWLPRLVKVDRQWITRRGLARFGPPKTKSSNRTIPASSFVLDYFSEHVGRRHEGFVLHRDGAPVDHNAFAHQWRRAAIGAGLGRWVKDKATGRKHYDGIHFHALRHAFASMLISAGCSVKAVQLALGHASAKTTLDVYAHLWPGDEDRVRQAVDRELGRQAEDSLRTGAGGE
jgi:integrase